jgi:hypothetical protein
MWVRHQTVYDKHVHCLKNKIIKPYNMAIRDFYKQVIKMYSCLHYMQLPSMNNQAWYEAKWHTLYNQPTDEHLRVAICNGLPKSMQDKLDQKDKDYQMVSNETFLDYLYHLEM